MTQSADVGEVKMNVPRYPQEGFDLGLALGALRRRLWTVLIIVLVVNAITACVLLVLPTTYSATASLLVDPATGATVAGKPAAKSLPDWLPGDNSVMATQADILKSPELARRVITRLGLQADAEFQPFSVRVGDRARTLWREWNPLSFLPESWRRALPRAEDTPAAQGTRVGQDEVVPMHDVVRRFLERLSVGQVDTSHVINVSFAADTPERAAAISNAVVQQYMDDQLTAKVRQVEVTLEWANKRTEEMQKEVIKAEEDVADYLGSNGLVGADGIPQSAGGKTVQQLLQSLEANLATAQADMALRDAKLNSVRTATGRPGSFGSLPEVAESKIIIDLHRRDAALRVEQAQLVSTYGLGHPAVQRINSERAMIAAKTADETAKIAQSIQDAATRARGRVAELQNMIAQERAQYAKTDRTAVRLRDLNRTAEAKRALYEVMLQRVTEVREQGALVEPDARLLARATAPSKASFPNLTLIGGISLAGSLALGIVFAGLREQLDRRLHTGPQLEETLGLRNIGLVPRITARRARRGVHSYLLEKPDSAYAESVRGILTDIKTADTGLKVVLVTSAQAGEGKTSLAMSLGALAARRGMKAIVVDLDLRRPGLRRALAHPVEAGLAELMAGEKTLKEVTYVHPDQPNLHVIALREPVRCAGDVLAAWSLALPMRQLRREYDLVLLDLPPLLATADIRSVRPLADGAVLVVRWGQTSHAAVANAKDALLRTGIPFLGSVLMGVDPSRHALYGDAGDYYRKYRQYFVN